MLEKNVCKRLSKASFPVFCKTLFPASHLYIPYFSKLFLIQCSYMQFHVLILVSLRTSFFLFQKYLFWSPCVQPKPTMQSNILHQVSVSLKAPHKYPFRSIKKNFPIWQQLHQRATLEHFWLVFQMHCSD